MTTVRALYFFCRLLTLSRLIAGMFFQDSTDYFAGGKATTLKKACLPCHSRASWGASVNLRRWMSRARSSLAAAAVVFEAGGDQLIATPRRESSRRSREAPARRLARA